MKTLATTLFAAAVVLPLAVSAQNVPGQHFLDNWDLNEDGQIDAAEITERRGDIFYTFDADEDGILTAEEYVQLDEARASDMEDHGDDLGQGGRRAMKGMDLSFNDTNGDGQVDRQEFLDHSADFLGLIDRNNDGLVTSKDFGPNRG